jgi:hypothetical protein
VEPKKFTWDARDVAATVLAAITITLALLFPAAAPVATILNGLLVALLLRPRTGWWHRRDLIAVATGPRPPPSSRWCLTRQHQR